MELTPEKLAAVARVAEQARLDFILLFGSALDRPEGARDVDLAVGAGRLGLQELTDLKDRLEAILRKPADLVPLRPGLSPVLVREIACRSRMLWASEAGRARYAELIDRLLAVAEDDLLSCPRELRDEALRSVQERLRVS